MNSLTKYRWERYGTTIKGDEKTIFYRSIPAGLRIESRRRRVPHNARPGYWLHTTYFLISPDGTEKEYYSLRDAKEGAEA